MGEAIANGHTNGHPNGFHREPMGEAEIRRSLSHFRDQSFADFFALALGLACESHPDVIRSALAKVFDLSVVEDTCKRIMLVASQAQAQAHQAVVLAQEVIHEIDQLEKRIDGLRLEVESLTEARRTLMNGRATG